MCHEPWDHGYGLLCISIVSGRANGNANTTPIELKSGSHYKNTASVSSSNV